MSKDDSQDEGEYSPRKGGSTKMRNVDDAFELNVAVANPLSVCT